MFLSSAESLAKCEFYTDLCPDCAKWSACMSVMNVPALASLLAMLTYVLPFTVDMVATGDPREGCCS